MTSNLSSISYWAGRTLSLLAMGLLAHLYHSGPSLKSPLSYSLANQEFAQLQLHHKIQTVDYLFQAIIFQHSRRLDRTKTVLHDFCCLYREATCCATYIAICSLYTVRNDPYSTGSLYISYLRIFIGASISREFGRGDVLWLKIAKWRS